MMKDKIRIISESDYDRKTRTCELKMPLYKRNLKGIKSFYLEKFKEESSRLKYRENILFDIVGNKDKNFDLLLDSFYLEYKELFMFDNDFIETNSLVEIETSFSYGSVQYLNTTNILLSVLEHFEYSQGIENIPNVCLYENGIRVFVSSENPQKTLSDILHVFEFLGVASYSTRGKIYDYYGNVEFFEV